MLTIKKKHNLDFDSDSYLNNIHRQFNNVVRFAVNRVMKDNIDKESDIEKLVKEVMKNIDDLDASWIKTAVKKGRGIAVDNRSKNVIESGKKRKIYFGGKKNFFERKYGKITEEEYKDLKLMPLNMRGSKCDSMGNRKATLLDAFTFMFKPKKGKEYIIDLKLSKNERKMLEVIAKECKEGTNYFNFEIDKEYVYISFEEPIIEKEKKK